MIAPGTPRIAVFGSSEPTAGDPLYEQAVDLGRRLALRGWVVLTGGYGGVMEGASRGAAEAGGVTEGVTCAVFADRRPNPWVRRQVRTADLHERTARLIDAAAGFVVLAGKAGTLAELAQLWALERAGCLRRRPVILLGRQWELLLPSLGELEVLAPQQLAACTVVKTPAEAVAALEPLPPQATA